MCNPKYLRKPPKPPRGGIGGAFEIPDRHDRFHPPPKKITGRGDTRPKKPPRIWFAQLEEGLMNQVKRLITWFRSETTRRPFYRELYRDWVFWTPVQIDEYKKFTAQVQRVTRDA